MFADSMLLTYQYGPSLGYRYYGWSLHGLWPQDTRSRYAPRNCGHTRLLYSEIHELIPELQIIWPNLVGNRNDANDFSFWDQQWQRHGSCSGLTQFEYFEYATLLGTT